MITLAFGMVVLLGTAIQRVTGLGFALVSAPLLVTVLGARDGVRMTLLLGFVVAAFVLSSCWRSIEPKTVVMLLAGAVVGVIPGALVAARLPASRLTVLVGSLAVLALATIFFKVKLSFLDGTPGRLGTGVVSGFMNQTSGLSGPPLVLYATATSWAHLPYLATTQCYFIGLNTVSLSIPGLPELDPTTWLAAGIGMLIGLVIGRFAASRTPEPLARKLVVCVALAGSVVTIAKGIAMWN